MTSSPLPKHGSKSQTPGEYDFKMTAGSAPSRRELAAQLGVDYDNRAGKQFLRKQLKDTLRTYFDITKKPFKQLDWAEELYPVLKKCRAIMHKEHQIDMSKSAMYHLLHFVYEDIRRNTGTKARKDQKRKEELKLKVSCPRTISTEGLTPALTKLTPCLI